MFHYLSPIYEDGKTKLGTFGKITTKANNPQRAINLFRKVYQGQTDMHGDKIIGVKVETMNRPYADPIKVQRIMFEGV